MSDIEIKVRLASVDDILAIQHIASVTWPVAYVDILSARQMSYMLSGMYRTEVLTEQMQKQGHSFLIAERGTEKLGFAGFSPVQYQFKPDVITEGDEIIWKLQKLYVLPAAQKLGIGKLLMHTLIEYIQQNQGNYLILNVNRENKSMNYYQKEGFEIIETGDFDIGSGFFMNDYIMGKRLLG